VVLNVRPDDRRNARKEDWMYRTVFLLWLAIMTVFAADLIYVGWDLVAADAGLR
jgi:hypothetical protein